MNSPSLGARPQGDNMATQLNASEACDQLKAMRYQEETTYRIYDYISETQTLFPSEINLIDEECRVMMCNWCYQVVDFCNFQREMVSITFSILDRFLCTEEGRSAIFDRRLYQLAAMTSLYVAIKINETVSMEPALLVQLSRGAYSECDFEEMETNILDALDWRVNGPTPLAFIRCFVSFIPDSVDLVTSNEVMSKAQHQVELSIFDYTTVNCRPSEIAFAAIANAIMEVEETVMFHDVKREFVSTMEKLSGLHANDMLDAHSISYLLPSGMGSTTDDKMAIDSENSRDSISHPNSPMSVAGREIAQC